LNRNKNTTFDDGTPDNNMEHAQKYGGIKPVLLLKDNKIV
jgi:hypothetical protein